MICKISPKLGSIGISFVVISIVGMTWEELTSWCPSGVVPACNNSQTIVTVSGDEKAVSRFVKEVSNRGIFCKAINSAGVAFHSHHMVQVAPRLRSTLANVRYRPYLMTSPEIYGHWS